MTNVGAGAPCPAQDQERPWREHRALSGSAVVDPAVVTRLGHAAFLTRLVYNAAIDQRTPFADGLEYRLRLAEARRAGTPEPAEPARSDRFLPVPTPSKLGPELTRLRAEIPALALFPRSMLDNAVSDACRARRAHAKACAKANEKGARLPRLHFRRADDDWTVSTDDFQLLRIGTDHAQRPPKAHHVTATTLRNRRRRAQKKERREEAWAEAKRRCGWNEDRVAAGLAKRKDRQDRDREYQQALQVWTADERREKRVRRDSPKATFGADRVKADVLGIGRIRLDLGLRIPAGSEKVRLTLVKPAWRGAKVECRVTFTVPEAKPDIDPLETGRRLHEALCHLPDDATELDAVEAVRAAGIVVRGQDLGIANPSCDDRGVTTKPVRFPRVDLREMRRAQQSLAHKDRCRKEGPKPKPAREKGREKEQAPAEVAVVEPVAATTPEPTVAERKARPKRSAAAERERAVLTRLNHRAADRQRTRAHQDAALLMRDAPVLVATDPTRMVEPLLAKDGPGERRARRLAGEGASPAVLMSFVMTEKRQRAMRRNLHATRFAERIRRVGVLAERAGAIHCTPGHEGTSAGCPGCERVRRKDLRERRHDCPCGLSMPRDQASALVTLGRALLPFRLSPDPGGAIAQAISDKAEARAKILAMRQARTAASVAASAARRASRDDDGRGVPRQPGRGVSGPPAAKPKRVRGQGRNVRRTNGQRTAGSN